jgi:hypothetical protein
MGVSIHCSMTPAWRPCIRFLFVGSELPSLASFGFHLAVDTLCLDGRFRSLRPVEDFHLLNTRHAWRTIKSQPVNRAGGGTGGEGLFA